MGKKSIIQNDGSRCFVCGRMTDLECHHILGGPNRKWSEKYKLTVMLCHEHHTGPNGAQYDRKLNNSLKRLAQIAFEARYSHDEWMKVFRKNYL
jgi:hypothetical protein